MEIKATMVDGKFLAEDSTAPAGQDIVIGLLERCFLWSEIVLKRYFHPLGQLLTIFAFLQLMTATGKGKSTKDSSQRTKNWSTYGIN